MNRHIKFLIITVASVFLIAVIIILFKNYFKDGKISEDASITLSSEEVIAEEIPPELLEDDLRMEEERGREIGYIDTEDVLMNEHMMSIENHIKFTEYVSKFIINAGYYSETMTIIPESAEYQDNTSHFMATLDNYDNVKVLVYSYNKINHFNFVLYKDDVEIATTFDDFEKESEKTDALLEELDKQYREIIDNYNGNKEASSDGSSD